jgi:hypothetical protein
LVSDGRKIVQVHLLDFFLVESSKLQHGNRYLLGHVLPGSRGGGLQKGQASPVGIPHVIHKVGG